MKRILVALGAVVAMASANAQLQARDGGMVYDATNDVTWLADMTSAGRLSWADSLAWADGLTFGGYSDWRLPTIGSRYDAPDNELHQLFVVDLGYVYPGTFANATALQQANAALFSNVTTGHWYSEWGGDGNGAYESANAFTSAGMQDHITWQPGSPILFYAIAVRDGDVAVTPVPEPSTYALMLVGLGALAFVARRRSA